MLDEVRDEKDEKQRRFTSSFTCTQRYIEEFTISITTSYRSFCAVVDCPDDPNERVRGTELRKFLQQNLASYRRESTRNIHKTDKQSSFRKSALFYQRVQGKVRAVDPATRDETMLENRHEGLTVRSRVTQGF